ncbi:MAG TPA: sigma-70 family RNA polymerase sigma factor [Ohtaekwangia sp.]
MRISENLLLKNLKTGDNSSFEYLYKTSYPSVEFYIRKNSGTPQDARDTFQEAIVVLLEKINRPDFVLTSSLKTYLFAISRNLWLKHLRDNKLVYQDHLPDEIEEVPSDVEVELPVMQKIQIWLSRVTANCQRILKALFFYEEPMDVLMAKMGWKNKHTAANQKYKCIEQVKKEMVKEL